MVRVKLGRLALARGLLSTPLANFEYFIVSAGVSDWSIKGFELTGNSGDSMISVAEETSNILFYDNKGTDKTVGIPIRASAGPAVKKNKKPVDNFFVVDNEIANATSFGAYVGGWHLAMMGNLIYDTDFQITRVTHTEWMVVSHNELRNPGVFGTFTLRNIDSNKTCDWCKNDTHHVVFADNYFFGSDDKILSMVGKNASGEVAHGNTIIVERNYLTQFKGAPNSVQTAIDVQQADNVTIRNNIVFMKDWKGGRGIKGQRTQVKCGCTITPATTPEICPLELTACACRMTDRLSPWPQTS